MPSFRAELDCSINAQSWCLGRCAPTPSEFTFATDLHKLVITALDES